MEATTQKLGKLQLNNYMKEWDLVSGMYSLQHVVGIGVGLLEYARVESLVSQYTHVSHV